METEKTKPDSTSPDWQAMAPYWDRVKAVAGGRDAMIAAGQEYLPKYPHETQTDYDFRLATARYTNIYGDNVRSLAQKPFSEEVTVSDQASDRILELIEDIDGRGNHLHIFAADTFYDGINSAIDWILIDYAQAAGLRTVEEERKAGVRPYWVHVPASAVIWIESDIIDGREQLTLVRILEDKGRVKTFERDGNSVTWYVEEEADGAWIKTSEGAITIGVIPMVPFITGKRIGNKWQFEPPMRDAVDLQVELYQEETALKYIKALTCFPMLAGNGVDPEVGPDGKAVKVEVGPAAVIYAPPNNEGAHGTWTWIGPDAASLNFLASDIKDTTRELRELCKQPLTAQSGNLTVITTAFAGQKGNSAVQAWALRLKDTLENALKITALWLGESDGPEVSVFTDFGLDDQSEKAPEHILKMRENGDLSQETLWQEFKRRGILGPDFSAEKELEERLFNELPGGDLGPDGP